MNIISVDEWFEFRELRNQISHEYDFDDKIGLNIINLIYENLDEFEKILSRIEKLKE